MLKLIPGKKIAIAKQEFLRAQILAHTAKPSLKIIQVGLDVASTLYVNLKIEAARALGIDAEKVDFPESVAEAEVIETIQNFNDDPHVHGIMVQSPIVGKDLGSSLKIFNSISPSKDVDGLNYASLGKLWQLKNYQDLLQSEIFISATPRGVLDCLIWISYSNAKKDLDLEKLNMLDKANTVAHFEMLYQLLAGKKALIINRSNIVGKPLAALLEIFDATVTIAHSKTANIVALSSDYDFILPATGIENLFDIEDFGPGKIVIDIGISSRDINQKVVGDVKFTAPFGAETSDESITYLAGVPGGVGPLTVTNLLENTYISFLNATTK